MHKWKTAISLLLAALLVVAFAWMPRLVGAITDRISNGKAVTAPIRAVTLAASGNDGDTIRKLALNQRGTPISIDQEVASMSVEDVYLAALAGMEAYVDAGLFEWFSYSSWQVTPYLWIDLENRDNNAIFWTVLFYLDNQGQTLSLDIDDETGKIYRLNYYTSGTDRDKYTLSSNRRALMERFVEVYSSSIGLTQEPVNTYKNYTGADSDETEPPHSLTSAKYTFEDETYGLLYLSFVIFGEGFYIEFSA